MTTSRLSTEIGVLPLCGEINFSTVTALKRKLEKIPKKIDIELNFSEITKVDSSAIAFLVFALQFSRRNESTLRITHMTEPMKKLAKLYAVDGFLLGNY